MTSLRELASSSFRLEEVRHLFQLSWPVVLSNILSHLMSIVDLIFIGHIGSKELAAASLGNAFFFSLSFIVMGMASAMDTLISQAYGARNFRLIGIVLQRGVIVTSITVVPIMIVLAFGEQIGVLIGQEPDVAKLAGTFIWYLLPGLWPLALYRTITKYLSGQGIMMPPVIVAIICNVLNVLANFVLIQGKPIPNWSGLGFIGAPIATSISRILQPMILLVLVRVMKLHKDTWDGFHLREALSWQGMLEFLRLGIPGTAMVALEVWGFEGTTVLSGYFGDIAVSAHAIILNVCVLTFMVPFSVSIAANIRVGNLLGAADGNKARAVTFLSLCIGATAMLVAGITMFVARWWIGRIYSSDPAVLAMVAKTIPLAAAFQVFDGIQTVCAGILRGMGRQKIGAIFNFIAYYVLGLPFGACMAFWFKWGLLGLWAGLLASLFCVAAVLAWIVLFRTNWDKEVDNAQKRVALDTSKQQATEDVEGANANNNNNNREQLEQELQEQQKTYDDDDIDVKYGIDDNDDDSKKQKQQQQKKNTSVTVSVTAPVPVVVPLSLHAASLVSSGIDNNSDSIAIYADKSNDNFDEDESDTRQLLATAR